MTKVIINPGACGMPAAVELEKKDGKTFAVKITSECAMVEKLGREIAELTLMDAFKRLLDNPVYKKGATCLRHVACPVPSGILKALEVEAGLNLPKDVSIVFVKDEAPEENK
ncbi:MAG: hypothetical protein M1510_03620 [Nitrospirae bacterium]|nr:hypothetical protein [Nitrospirota bacterium]MCL5237801.1 hypothetical protein [Nitrospirota bacterium]